MSRFTVEEMRDAFVYLPETGEFFHKKNNRPNINKAGKAGTVSKVGYVYLSYRNISIPAHRVAMAIMEGRWPPHHVDHINRVKTDNRYCNLRHATHSENLRNKLVRRDSSTGIKGVQLRANGRWRAYIKAPEKLVHLGCFDTPEEATRARIEAAKIYHGEFARDA